MEFVDVPHIIVDVVFVIFYVAFGTYAVVRVRRSNKSSTTTDTVPSCLGPVFTDSETVSRYFFYFLPFHCFARLQETILRRLKVFKPHSTIYIGGTLHLAFIAFPAVTFMILLYIYLRVWQLQAHELTISSPFQTKQQTPLMEVRKRRVIAWFMTWGIALGLDFILDKYDIVQHVFYASHIVYGVNFVVISCLFCYLGSKMHTALELP